MKPIYLLLAGVLACLILACSGDDTPEATPVATATPDPFEARISEEVWRRVQATPWYNDGNYGRAGANLLEIIVTGGPLWRESSSRTLLDSYPEGIPQSTLDAAKSFARMSLSSLHEVILSPWLVDGVDEYERAILAQAESGGLSVSALRRALTDGFFRPTYGADPEWLTAERINAIGSLSPRVLELVEAQDWFTDGIDSFEASLLGILNTLLSVDEQLLLLETGNYRPLAMLDRSIAVVYLENDEERVERAHSVASAWIQDIERFVGEFRPIGLVIDTTPLDEADACHTGDGGGTRPGRIALPASYCYQTTVMIHELTHAFIGGRYPTWFAEGVAEVTSYHLTGTRAGYVGGEGTIQLETRNIILTNQYRNQAALGADFLEAVYDLAGAEEMSVFIQDVAGRSMSGAQLLTRIRAMEIEDRQALEDIIADHFGITLASP